MENKDRVLNLNAGNWEVQEMTRERHLISQ